MKHLWVIWLCVALISGCAQIRSVEGGPKDTTPPQLVSERVPNGQTNWKDQSLTFAFDEYIQLEDVQNQIIISPTIQPSPSFNVKGKSVIVKWEKPLAENTTYTFQFGDAIVDLTEGNPTALERVYSTGNFLDSLQMNFKVKNRWTQKEPENAVIMLLKKRFHPDSLSHIAYQKKVSNGACDFQHLPNRSFFIVAFQDNNKDGQWSAEEWLDWIDEPLNPSTLGDTTLLSLAPNKINFTSLLHSHVDSIGLAKWYWPRAETPEIKTEEPYEGNATIINDTLYYQLKGMPDDRYHTIKVMWGKGEIDSLSIPFYRDVIANFHWKKVQAEPVLLNEQSPQLYSTLPIERIQSTRYTWHINQSKSNAQLSFQNSHLMIQPEESKSGKYELTILPKCFTTFGVEWPKDTVEITGQIQTKEERGLVQWKFNPSVQTGYYLLIDESGKNVQFEASAWPKFSYLNPGKYQLKWIDDQNHDQQWTTHDFKTNLRAEAVKVYPGTIQVRANWTQIIDWSTLNTR